MQEREQSQTSPGEFHFNFVFKPKIKSTDADGMPTMYREVCTKKKMSKKAFCKPKTFKDRALALEQWAPCSVHASRSWNNLFKLPEPKVFVFVFVLYLNLRGGSKESHFASLCSLRIKPSLELKGETLQLDAPDSTILKKLC